MLRQQRILVSLALIIVLVCVSLRLLAFGWFLVLFGLAYIPFLCFHVFVHARYAAMLRLNAVTVTVLILSHLALLVAFLFQRDFTDTPYALTPFSELFGFPPPQFHGGGSELVFNIGLFLPVCILWALIWQTAHPSAQ